MAEVTLSINGRPYKIGCDEGQEERVLELGAYIDDTVSQMASAGAASNDSHLLVLAGLVMADELYDLRAGKTTPASQDTPVDEAPLPPVDVVADEAAYAELVDHLTERVEALAKRLEQA